MGKRITYQDIENYINSKETGNGCKLITMEKEFEEEKIKQDKNSSKVKLKIRCSCTEIFETNFDSFKSKNKTQCNKCSGKYKVNYEEVKTFIEIESNSQCKLLTTKDNYKSIDDTINIQCKCGEPFVTTFKRFKLRNKRHCNKCGIKNIIIKQRTPFLKIKNIIEVESESGCKLLSNENEYINSDSILRFQCKCGKEFNSSFELFLKYKQQCDECGEKIRRENLSVPYDVVKEYIENYKSNNCKLITSKDDYKNASTLLKIQCGCGNIFYTSYKIFRRELGSKNKCEECAIKDKKILCLKKYGVDSPMKNMEVRAKMTKTLYKNGTAPCSKQQEYLHNVIGGELNYPYYNASLDIAFPDEKLYVEGDFGGHWLSIKLGSMTEKEFKNRERKRWYSLYNSGWKEIRIISKNDKLPSDEVILSIIDFAKEYLSQNHHYIKFDIDNSEVITSQYQKYYEFGELRRITKNNLTNQEINNNDINMDNIKEIV